MRCRLFPGQRTLEHAIGDPRVVGRQEGQHAVTEEICPTVSDVCERQHRAGDDRRRERAAHSGAFDRAGIAENLCICNHRRGVK